MGTVISTSHRVYFVKIYHFCNLVTCCSYHAIVINNLNMAQYQQSLRSKVVREAKLKLSVHREQGVKSNMSIYEVAELMDKIRKGSEAEEKEQSIFFSVNLN